MNLPQLNLGSLEFDDIKNSIKTYLKSQDTFTDYNFEGSAMSVLVDLLAYNTLYYGFYSNMIANEIFFDSAQKISSLISLAKPLGYVVPGARASAGKVAVRVGGSNRFIPKYHPFIGKNDEGSSLTFYSYEDSTTNSNGEVDLYVYQGSSLIQNTSISLTNNNSIGYIGGDNIDIRSLTIEVKLPTDEDYREWSKSDNINSSINSSSEVYFLERFDDGFYVIFGGNVPNENLYPSPGKSLPLGSLVRASYVIPSGEVANNYGAFYSDFTDTEVNDDAIVQTLEFSGGGSMEPNLDSIKFFAPKWFSAQGRVITKDDAIAALGETTIGESVVDSNLRFNVWGGEETNPPFYGRVFVSLLNSNPEGDIFPNLSEIQTAISQLKDRMTITVFPEFVYPIESTYFINLPLLRNPQGTSATSSVIESRINSFIRDNYSQRKFNNSFNIIDFSREISQIQTGIEINLEESTSYFEFIVSETSQKRFYDVKNRIKKITDSDPRKRAVTTTEPSSTLLVDIDGNQYQNVYIADFPNETNIGELRAYVIENNIPSIITNKIGTVNYLTGNIQIDAGVITTASKLKVILNSINFTAKHEMVTDMNISITVKDID